MNDLLYDPEILRKLCARMPKIDFRAHPKPPSKAETERARAMMDAMTNALPNYWEGVANGTAGLNVNPYGSH